MKKLAAFLMALALITTALFLVSAQEKSNDKKRVKIHISTEIRDDLGMSAEDVEKASRWFFSGHGLEVVDESGDDVIELHVVVGQDDADDDNDNVPDSKDTDDDGDKIEDSKETEFAVDLDKAESDVMDDFERKDKQRGVYIIFYTAGKKSEHIRGFSEVDSFETEEETEKESSSLNRGMVIFQKASFAPVPTQTPKTTPTPKPTPVSAGRPTSVNDQITDSVTQANVKVLGEAPAIAMGNLYMATAQALSNAAHNATNAQQQTNITGQAATTMGVATLYSIDTAATGIGIKDLFSALGKAK